MNEEQFRKFVDVNKKKLPLYFSNFQFKEIYSKSTTGKKLQKTYKSHRYNSEHCIVEKPCKLIMRFDYD